MTQTSIPKLVLQLGIPTTISMLGFLFLNPLMHFLGSTDTILVYAKEYAFYILLAAPIMCSSYVLNNVLRYEGRAIFAMIGLA